MKLSQYIELLKKDMERFEDVEIWYIDFQYEPKEWYIGDYGGNKRYYQE